MKYLFKDVKWIEFEKYTFKSLNDYSLFNNHYTYIECFIEDDYSINKKTIDVNINYFVLSKHRIIFKHLIGGTVENAKKFFDDLTEDRLKLYMVFE